MTCEQVWVCGEWGFLCVGGKLHLSHTTSHQNTPLTAQGNNLALAMCYIGLNKQNKVCFFNSFILFFTLLQHTSRERERVQYKNSHAFWLGFDWAKLAKNWLAKNPKYIKIILFEVSLHHEQSVQF